MEGDEEGDICRVCRTGASPDRPLNYPCKCSGSIRFIHQDCLMMWLSHSKSKYCELCGHHFEFTPIYADNAPTVLPPHEMLVGLFQRASQGLKGALRVGLVVLCWFILVPLATSSTFYFYFGRPSYGFALKHLKMSPIVMDCAFGTFIAILVIFVCLLIMSLMDFVNNMQIIENNNGAANNVNNNQPNVVENNQNNQNQAEMIDNNNLNENGHENENGNGNGNGNGNEDDDALNQLINNGDDADDEDIGDIEDEFDEENADPDAIIAHYNEVMAMFDQIPLHADLALPDPPADNNIPDVAEMDQLEEDENVIGNALFGFLDGNGGEVDFNELVGIAGPLTVLVSKVIALILFNAFFLAVFALVPLMLGRFILQLRHYPLSIMQFATSYFHSIILQELNNTAIVEVVNSTLSNISAVVNTTLALNTTLDSVADGSKLVNVTSEIASGDIDAVVIGYLFIAGFCMAWIGLTLSLSANFALSRNPVYRTIIKTLKLVLTAVKVACVMFSELGVFPLLVGNALDICTLGLFGANFDARLAFCKRNALVCQVIHWGLGFAYMILFASFVGWVREVVRPGVLWFFRDPSDPNFNPLKDIVDQPASRHVKRLLLSAVIYAVIIALVVFLPIFVCRTLWPSMFPLTVWLGDPFYEGPIDLIFVHVIVPYTLEYCHPKANFKTLLRTWIVFVSNKLGIAEYMLPAPAGNANAANANAANAPNANAVNQANPVNPPANGNQPANAVGPYKPPLFGLRILAILNCAWISMFIFNSLIVFVPIICGRLLFAYLAFPLTNDMYTFCAGFYAIYGITRIIHTTVSFMTSLPLPQIASEMYYYCKLGMKCSIIGLFLGIIIPLLIGLVFELVFAIPWRVAVDQTPHHFIYQDWGLGLIFMKIWYRLIVARTEYIRLHPAAAHREGYDLHAIEWKAKIDQIFQDGFSHLSITRVFTLIIFPILDKLLILLCVPYVIAKGIVPLLGGSLLFVSAIYRYGFLALSLSIIVSKLRRPLVYSFRSLHNAIRDDKYLVGRRLHNYTTGVS